MEVSNARTLFSMYDSILSCSLLANENDGKDALIPEKAESLPSLGRRFRKALWVGESTIMIRKSMEITEK